MRTNVSGRGAAQTGPTARPSRGAGRKLALTAGYGFLSLATLALVWASLAFLGSGPVQRALTGWAQQRMVVVRPTAPVLPVEAGPVVWMPPAPVVSPAGQVAAGARMEGRMQAAGANAAALAGAGLPEASTGGAAKQTRAPAQPIVPNGLLVIPELELSESLMPLPVVDGAWDIDMLDDRVGWLETTGAYPGDERAMAVIGHITLPPPGGAGPFFRLTEVEPGDTVEYHAGGIRYIYRVERWHIIRPEDVETIYQPDGNKLLLITCTGWNALTWTYDLRLVVEASMEKIEASPDRVE
jgi:LPXTG-site transpeptidase (sortase) family protein